MKLCSYVIKTDSGLAPNPFWEYCTLALCTPNHQKARMFPGDWIVGNSPTSDGHRLVYAMRIDEVLDFDSYFRDPRFRQKRPKPQGTLEEQAGDNFYFRENGVWKRLPSRFHNDQSFFYKDLGKDLSGRPVFIGKHYYYFGDKRISFPEKFSGIVRRNRGMQYTEGPVAVAFINWLEKNHRPGMIGMPANQSDRSHEYGGMIKNYSPRMDTPPRECRCPPKLTPGMKKHCS